MYYYAAPMEGLTDRVWRQAIRNGLAPPEPQTVIMHPFCPRRKTGCSSGKRWLSWPRKPIPAPR